MDVPSPEWEQARLVLKEWRAKAEVEKSMHKAAERRRSTQYWAIGIPTIVLSAVVTSAVFGTLNKQAEKFSFGVQVAIGVVSILATVLVALDKFLKSQERAAAHLALYQEAVAIVQEIDILLAVAQQGQPKPILDSISRRLSALAGDKIVHP